MKMYKRKCRICGKEVEVKSSQATKVKCEDCRINVCKMNPKEKRCYDTDDFVFCRICNTARRRLDSHIRMVHEIKVEQYHGQYPEAPIFAKNSIKNRKRSDESKKKTSKALKKSWSNQEVHDRRVEQMRLNPSTKGHKLTEEHKQKIAEGVKETKSKTKHITLEKKKQRRYNKKLNLEEYIVCPLCLKETNDEVMSRIQLITLSHLKKHGYTTEQFRKKYPDCKVSHDTQKIIWEDNFDVSNYREIIKKANEANLVDTRKEIFCRCCFKSFGRISPYHLEQHELTMQMYQELFPNASLVAKDVIVESTANFAKTYIEKNLDFGKSIYGHSGTRKDIGHYVRSMIEANFCRVLKCNNIRYKYEPEIFKLKHDNFNIYIPDIRLLDNFLYWSTDSLIELKHTIGDDSIKKVNVFREQYPEESIYFFAKRSKEWKRMERMYKSKIPLWETRSQNIKVTPELYKM